MGGGSGGINGKPGAERREGGGGGGRAAAFAVSPLLLPLTLELPLLLRTPGSTGSLPDAKKTACANTDSRLAVLL